MNSTDFEANIKQIYLSASEAETQDGLVWYDVANSFAKGLADSFNISIQQAAGIIAALSPQVSWVRNMIAAEQLCQDPNTKPIAVFPANYLKAKAIFEDKNPLAILGGNKVRSFYANILLSPSAVTIDRHAIAIAYGKLVDTKLLERKGNYERIAEAYRKVAEELELMPYQLQAITWLTWRRMLNDSGKRGIRK